MASRKKSGTTPRTPRRTPSRDTAITPSRGTGASTKASTKRVPAKKVAP